MYNVTKSNAADKFAAKKVQKTFIFSSSSSKCVFTAILQQAEALPADSRSALELLEFSMKSRHSLSLFIKMCPWG